MNKNAKKAVSSRKTLWVVSELYYPEETSTGYYLTKIAEGLADDCRVKALCGQPNYSGRGTRSPKRETRRGVEIHRAWGTRLDKNIIPFRLLNMLTLGGTIFWKALFNFQKNQRVLVVTTPPVLPFITAAAAILRGAEYVLLIHDNYPEILVAVGKTRANSAFVKILDYFNRKLYRSAAKIIVVGRDMRELVEKKIGNSSVPIEYIPNWAELEQVAPAERKNNRLLSELGLTEKFVFLYAGNMGHPNDLESLVECAAQLRDEPQVHFIFLGTGVKRKWLEGAVEGGKSANITLLAPRPRSEQNDFLNACDVAVVSLIKKMKGVSMPSRTYNILAVGKPILALTEKDSEVARVIEEDSAGWIVPPEDPDELRRVILEIARQPAGIARKGENSRRSALLKYSLKTAVEKYRKALI